VDNVGVKCYNKFGFLSGRKGLYGELTLVRTNSILSSPATPKSLVSPVFTRGCGIFYFVLRYPPSSIDVPSSTLKYPIISSRLGLNWDKNGIKLG
jgi:hypothetical protein